METQMLWKGRQIAECSEPELREVIAFLMNERDMLRDAQTAHLRTELARVTKENERLWSALGARA